MTRAFRISLWLVPLLVVSCFISVPSYSTNLVKTQEIIESVDLVENWNFTDTEYGGWEGNNHTNISKPTHWQFWGHTEGPKEQYRTINDTANGGDSATLYACPTQSNKQYTIMVWQDFVSTNINNVTIQHRSRASGPCALILLYGLNEGITEDTPLSNGSIPYLTLIDPLNSTDSSQYWPAYTTYTISLSNLSNSYHHYRIHWQVIDCRGQPDAELCIAYCRVSEAFATTPSTPLPPTLPITTPFGILIGVILVMALATVVIFAVIYLYENRGLNLLPKRSLSQKSS